MRKILKFPLNRDFSTLNIIGFIKVVMFEMQNDLPTVWIETDSKGLHNLHNFQIVGTGKSIPEDCYHVGSCMDRPYGFVWHLYAFNHV